MLLALDTSTKLMGIALYDGVRVVYETTWISQDFHTVELAPAIAGAFKQVHLDISQLKVIAVASGPGSFTGLRIGMALAKGIALARHLPIIGMPTLDVVAYALPVQNIPLIAILQAGRGRLAAGWYHADNKVWKADNKLQVLDVHELSNQVHSPTLVCGELSEEERQILSRKRKNVLLASPARSLRRPSFLAEMAWKRWLAGKVDDPALLAPVYLQVGEPIPG